jgi:2-polyprenyl-6-methoxyphenol hydroxylase-like FAD-dependent oxidoreductase
MSRQHADAVTGTSPWTETYDVAIVGYGPTGMMLAALLGRQGHRVIVFDKHRGLYNLPRAACFDDEIMRTFQKLDLVDAVMPGVVVQTEYEWVNGAGETLLEMTYDNPARGGWAALYMMYQPHIEAVLDRLCQSLATIEVRQGVVVDGVQITDGEVTVTAGDRDGGRHDVRARYLVGADGGASFVRPALGIGFSDYHFQENWLVCDFRKRRELPLVPTFRQVCDPAQPVSIVRIGPEHQRFSFMLEPDETGVRATDERRVWQRVARYLTPDDAELVRVANYVFRSRIADRWRDGPVMLAGDAAHEMPPFLAQGMCSGMRDGHNLAWKLHLVLAGRADPGLLDTYQPEREPHVRFITEKAIELGRVQTLRDPELARERDERLLALRRARQAPDKIIYPGLTAGLLATTTPDAGAVFPQGRVRHPGADPVLFDDAIGASLTILSRSAEVLAALGPEQLDRWAELGGGVALIRPSADGSGSSPGPIQISDVDDLYDAWFDAHACEAVIVRPDWYLYGSATTGPGLRALVQSLEDALHPAARRAAA